MADKEERIEQFITIQQRTITTRDYEVNDEIISKDYPRQKAIERMAKALCKFISQGECKNKCKECDLDEQEKIFEKILPQHITFKEQANVMLNALLKGVKK